MHRVPFLQADEQTLLNRYKETRRRHPLAPHGNVVDGIRRDRAMTESIMDDLPGIGPARKRVLLKHFGSPDAVLEASREELEAVPGVPAKTARELHAHLRMQR